MGLKLSNNAISRLASGIAAGDLSLTVTAGEGARFPVLGVGDYFPATIRRRSDDELEIVRVTARSSDTFTIERAREDTTALAFIAGDIIELRLTVATFDDIIEPALSALDAALSVVSQDLSAIDKTVFSATLVDAILYDTSKDSDGGAWRKRCSHTSWENETLSGNWLGSAANEAAARAISGAVTGSLYYDTTAAAFYTLDSGSGKTAAYRGNTRQFPAQALITVEAARVILWDLTQAGVPMWMVFVSTAYGHIYTPMLSVAMLNGSLVAGMGTATGFSLIKFISDSATYRAVGTHAFYRKNIAGRNVVETGFGATIDAQYIVANVINDVAMTVLPNAPVDVATGLPIPTIDVFTSGGLSRIKNDGTVVNSTNSAGATTYYPRVGATKRDRTAMALAAAANVQIGPSITSTGSGNPQPGFSAFTNASAPALKAADSVTPFTAIAGLKAVDDWAVGASIALTLLRGNPATPASSLVAYITKDYTSGWLPGDVRGAWLADIVVETKTGGTDTDRSIKANDMTVNGALTKAVVASGAALVGYSGWSAANYCERAYDADFDFSTTGFCIMGWLDQAANSAIETLLERDSVSTAQRFTLSVTAAGYLAFTCDDNTTTRTATGTATVDDGVPRFVVCTYSAGTLTIYVNGVSYATATGAALLTLNNASAVLRIGCDVAGSYPATNAALALWRATATVPSAEQIKHIYETEKALFEANAQCCLAGTSNAVTALAYDEETDLLHVGTSYGRSAFKGLVRVASEATGVGAITALAAGAGIVAQAGATAVDVYVPAYLLREELLRDAEQMARFGQNLIAHDFTATASQTTFTLPVGWEIVAVYQQGALKRETTSWTRSFNGFVWSVVLGTGATVSDWISILAKRV